MKMKTSPVAHRNELAGVRRTMRSVLTQLGLSSRVTVEEIEDALFSSREIGDSPLILGLCARAMELNEEQGLDALLPVFIEWKHLLPSASLNGLSPFEHEELYPRGEIEQTIIEDLLSAYLDASGSHVMRGLFYNPAQSFAAFSASFMDYIPSYQPYKDVTRPLTHRELIERERSENARPATHDDALLFEPFVMRSSIDIALLTERITGTYHSLIDALTVAHDSCADEKTYAAINEAMLTIEPFMRCTNHAALFYLHCGLGLTLMGEHLRGDEYIEEALSIDPLLSDHFSSGTIPSCILIETKTTAPAKARAKATQQG